MKQSDAVQFLFRDLKVVTTHLVAKNYNLVFEDEINEYFPFNDTIMELLGKLYRSEKYGSFDEDKLSLYFEREHPFLFMRDLAHMNCWNLGFQRADRMDHITGLMFSENPTYALEATLCLCRPSLIKAPTSKWFDFKQAMTNLEVSPMEDIQSQAWKACGMFFLYFHLSGEGQQVEREELIEMLDPYLETIEISVHEGSEDLRQELELMTNILRYEDTMTMLDGLRR